MPPAFGPGQDQDESGNGKYDEIVQFGSSRSSGGRWLPRIALACLVLAAIVAVAVHGIPQHARHAAKTQPAPLVQVIGATPLPGVTGGCQLFIRGPAADLLRIKLALGKISVAFVPRTNEVVIRSTGPCPGRSCPTEAIRRC